MVDRSKKRKKITITEDNMSTVLRRYSVSTVIALLQEVFQAAGEKINWHEMVKNTATGICSAREYQMLWRHLAYRETLFDQIEPDLNPTATDDDSDLDNELEAFPAVGREVLVEATACVKVLISSEYTNNSNILNNSMVSTIDGPLTINIPNTKDLSTPSDSLLSVHGRQGTNITIPVTLQRVPSSSALCGEKRPGTEASVVNLPPRRKRRGWSVEEDQKLTAAMKNIAEPNWSLISSNEFNDDRKPSELSQRWANLKKKQGNLKAGTISNASETQLAAAHRAMSLALDMPLGDNLKPTSAGLKPQQLPRKPSRIPDQPLQRAASGPLKPLAPPKRPPTNSGPTPDSMVKAAAVAAGARIASASDASSLLEAARSQNVVHITTGGGPMMRSAAPMSLNKQQLPSNVHFIRNGLVKTPIPTKPNVPRPVEPQLSQSVTAVAQPSPEGSSVAKEGAQSNQTGDRADASQVQQAVPENQSAGLDNHEADVKSADGVAVPSSGVDENGKTNTDNKCTS